MKITATTKDPVSVPTTVTLELSYEAAQLLRAAAYYNGDISEMLKDKLPQQNIEKMFGGVYVALAGAKVEGIPGA